MAKLPKFLHPDFTSPVRKPSGPVVLEEKWQKNIVASALDQEFPGNTYSRKKTERGNAYAFNGTNQSIQILPSGHIPEVSGIVVCRSPSAPQLTTPASGPLHRETNFQVNWNNPSAGFIGTVAYQDSGETWRSVTYGPITANRWHVIGFSIKSGKGLRTFNDGELKGQIGSLGPISINHVCTLGKHASAAQYWQGDILGAWVFDRGLSDAEHKEIASEVYRQLYKPALDLPLPFLMDGGEPQDLYPFELPKHLHPDFVDPRKKPVGPVGIDWSHPLAKDLVFINLLGNPTFELIKQEKSTEYGNPIYNHSSISFDGGEDGFAHSARASDFIGDLTIISKSKVTSVSATRNMFSVGGPDEAEQDNFIAQLSITTSRELRTFWEYGSGTNALTVTSAMPASILGSWETYCVSRKTALTSSVNFYRNGANIGSASGVENPSGGGNSPLNVGFAYRTTGGANQEEWVGDIEYVFAFKRELTSEQVRSLSNNPYQILKPALPWNAFLSHEQYILYQLTGSTTYDMTTQALFSNEEVGPSYVQLEKYLHPDFANRRRKPTGSVQIDDNFAPLYYWDLNNPLLSRDIARGPGDSHALDDGAAPTLKHDYVGPKLEFNGDTTRLLTGNLAHGIGSGDFTVIAHIRTGSSGGNSYQGVVSNGDFSPGLIYSKLNSGAWGSYFGSNKQANTTLATDTEYVLGVNRVGATLSFYLSGLPDGTASGAGASVTNTFLRFGSSSTSDVNHFNGEMYSVAFDDRAYSAAEHKYIADNRTTWALKPAIPWNAFVPLGEAEAEGALVPFELPKHLHPDFVDPRKKPVGPVALREDNGLPPPVLFILPELLRDLVNPSVTLVPHVSAPGVGANERGLMFETGNSGNFTPYGIAVSGAPAIKGGNSEGGSTVIVAGRFLGRGGSGAIVTGMPLEINVNTTVVWDTGNDITSTNSISTGDYFVIVAGYEYSNPNTFVALDGIITRGDPGNFSQTGSLSYIGGQSGQGHARMEVAIFAQYDGLFTDAQILSLTNDLWGTLFKPAIPMMGVLPLGAGGGPTVDSLVGSITYLDTPAAAYKFIQKLQGLIDYDLVPQSTFKEILKLLGDIPYDMTATAILKEIANLIGSVQYDLTPQAVYKEVFRIAADVTYSLIPSAVYKQISNLSGDITYDMLTQADFKQAYKLLGDVPYDLTTQALFTLGYTLTGDIPYDLTTQAALKEIYRLSGDVPYDLSTQADFKEIYKLDGDIPYDLVTSAILSEAYKLVGDVPYSLTTQALFSEAFSLTGDVTYPLTPQADFKEVFTLDGDVPFSYAANSILRIRQKLLGDITYYVTPASVIHNIYKLDGDITYGMAMQAAFHEITSLLGDITYTVALQAQFKEAYSLDGSIQYDMLTDGQFGSTQALEGSISYILSQDSATKLIEKLSGQVNYNLSPVAEFLLSQSLLGDIGYTVDLQADLGSIQRLDGDITHLLATQANFKEVSKLDGDVTYTLDPQADFSGAQALTGAITYDLSPSGQFVTGVSLVGSITYTETPGAVFVTPDGLLTLWQIVTQNSTLPINQTNCFWDHLNNQDCGVSGPVTLHVYGEFKVGLMSQLSVELEKELVVAVESNDYDVLLEPQLEAEVCD